MSNCIIAIGRQFGSGGRTIGKKLAEDLNIPFFDKELIALAAEKSGMDSEILKSADEQVTNSLLYSLSTGAAMMGRGFSAFYNAPMTDRLFIIQSEIIKHAAQEGPCVIVGRCADYVLEGAPNLVSVFIHADLDRRIKRCVDIYGLNAQKAKDIILKTDKKRAWYYNYYTDHRWGVADNFDLSFNSGMLSIQGAVDLIKGFIAAKEEKDAEPAT